MFDPMNDAAVILGERGSQKNPFTLTGSVYTERNKTELKVKS